MTSLLLLLAPAAFAAVRTIPVAGTVGPLEPALPALTALPSPGALPAAAAAPSIRYDAVPAGLPSAGLLPASSVPSPLLPEGPAAGKTGLLPASLASTEDLVRAAVAAPTALGSLDALDTLYFGGRRKQPAAADAYIVNDEGIPVNGRAAAYYKEVRRLVNRLEPRVDLSESLGVMGDSYADVWAKLKTAEALSRGGRAGEANTHLEKTLTWVDAVIDRDGRREAVHTYRVYFHKAPNPRSEIEEGIRRADAYLDEVLPYFAVGGKAESALGPLDQVTLAFDARGYREVKSYLKARAREVEKATGGRVRFAFVDELARTPSGEAAMRAELAALIQRYRGQSEGLSKIIEGVIYSRYVGLVLELETILHYLGEGYQILQSGRELFDADGKYVTELDAVVKAPDGTVTMVEARAARVPLGVEQAAQKKVLYKLESYRKNRALIEAAIGGPLRVVFAMDVGFNQDLADHLKGLERSLSEEYGFPISFLFLESGPRRAPAGRKAGR